MIRAIMAPQVATPSQAMEGVMPAFAFCTPSIICIACPIFLASALSLLEMFFTTGPYSFFSRVPANSSGSKASPIRGMSTFRHRISA